MRKLIYLVSMLAIILAITSPAWAINYSIASHTITAQISTDGKDVVVEKFIIAFPGEQDKIDFRNETTRLGTNLDEWHKFNAVFAPSLYGNTYNKKITYNEGVESYLQISYSLLEGLMAKGKDSTFITEYNLKVSFFNSFYQSGLWIVPESTSVTIELPPGADLIGSTEPASSVAVVGNRKTVTWYGYKSANRLSLDYVVWKKIAPVVDLNEIMRFLSKTTMGLTIVGIIIVLIGGIFWQRRKIGKGIEDFVEKHSIIKEE